MRDIVSFQPMARPQRVETTEGRGPVRPPLKWAGGKRWQVPYLRPYWELNQHRRLVEPFCGGRSVPPRPKAHPPLPNNHNPHPVKFSKTDKEGTTPQLALK